MLLEQTFNHFLLQHQQVHGRTLNFSILMESILNSARYIQHYYDLAALHGNVGESGEFNIQGEKTMHLDKMAHEIVIHYLKESNQVIEATSEEIKEPIKLNENGRYLIYFDPLDGSSNIKHSLPVGFLFGIAKRNLYGDEDCHLRAGKEFIAAGMFLIPSGIFTFALKNSGAWQFLRDQSGVYIRPSRISFPHKNKTWELSWNSSNRLKFSKKIQGWIEEHEPLYNFRYSGSLAVDFHRLLHNGGLFMYPALYDAKDPRKNKLQGKLRLIYECSVVAFIAKEAGGIAIDESGNEIMNIIPQERHQRSTLFVGSKEVVEGLRKQLTP